MVLKDSRIKFYRVIINMHSTNPEAKQWF